MTASPEGITVTAPDVHTTTPPQTLPQRTATAGSSRAWSEEKCPFTHVTDLNEGLHAVFMLIATVVVTFALAIALGQWTESLKERRRQRALRQSIPPRENTPSPGAETGTPAT